MLENILVASRKLDRIVGKRSLDRFLFNLKSPTAHFAGDVVKVEIMEKLSSNEYHFSVSNTECGLSVILTQISSGKTKQFSFAVGNAKALSDHMSTLTESQCEQWFAAGERKKKKA